MLRSELVAALMARRDNEVEVRVGRVHLAVDRIEYHPDADKIIIRLDPVALAVVLEIIAEDGPLSLPGRRRQPWRNTNESLARDQGSVGLTTWRMHLDASYAALIVAGSKTVEVRAAYASRGDLAAGHLIWFDTDHLANPSILARVERVTRYPSVAKLLDSEDPATIGGAGATRDDIAALLASIYPNPVPGYLAIAISMIGPTAEPAAGTTRPTGGTSSGQAVTGVGRR